MKNCDNKDFQKREEKKENRDPNSAAKDENKSASPKGKGSGRFKQSQSDNKSKGDKNPRAGKTSADKSKEKSKNKDNPKAPKYNDWEWYAPSELIAQQVGSLPWNVFAGTRLPVNLTKLGDPDITKRGTRSQVFGMRLLYRPSYGMGDKRTSGINMAANQLYMYVRANNSGARNYESPDMMMLVMAIMDLYRNISEAIRAIRFANNWSFLNKSMPKDILEQLLDVDFDDLIANRAAYLARLNTLILQANSLAMPAYFKAILRKAYVALNVFSDTDGVTGTLIAFKAMNYWVFDTKTDENGTSLVGRVWSDFDAGKISFSVYLDSIQEQLHAILDDADASIIMGDILKAFPREGLLSIEQVSASDAMEVIFDENILAQIENATVGYVADGPHPITQTQGKIIVETETIRLDYYLNTRLFNSHVENPTYMDVLEWSRLGFTAKSGNDADHYIVTGDKIICWLCL